MNREQLMKEFQEKFFVKNGELKVETYSEIESFILSNFVPKEEQNKYIAWCPNCFDGLEVKPIMKNNLINQFEYYCFGCDKTFKLKQKKE